jgi:hypothetical protein
MAKAKTASKNNPTARAKQKDYFYNNQKVKPVKLISSGRKYMAVQYENGQLAMDETGHPIPWGKIRD